MKRIGIISDTHSYWDDKYLKYFEPCDEIWHAGDIGSLEVAERLNEFRPLRAVCGNCDGGDLRLMYPEVLRWKCEDVDVLMKHIGGYRKIMTTRFVDNSMLHLPNSLSPVTLIS